ncbi:hypothetical protein [Sphingobium ummariense]
MDETTRAALCDAAAGAAEAVVGQWLAGFRLNAARSRAAAVLLDGAPITISFDPARWYGPDA